LEPPPPRTLKKKKSEKIDSRRNCTQQPALLRDLSHRTLGHRTLTSYQLPRDSLPETDGESFMPLSSTSVVDARTLSNLIYTLTEFWIRSPRLLLILQTKFSIKIFYYLFYFTFCLFLSLLCQVCACSLSLRLYLFLSHH